MGENLQSFDAFVALFHMTLLGLIRKREGQLKQSKPRHLARSLLAIYYGFSDSLINYSTYASAINPS